MEIMPTSNELPPQYPIQNYRRSGYEPKALGALNCSAPVNYTTFHHHDDQQGDQNSQNMCYSHHGEDRFVLQAAGIARW